MATPAELLAQSLAKFRSANRIDGTRASYRKDNPGEYVSVMAYLDGGPRPGNVTSDMGLGFVLEEDARRALGGVEPPPPPPPDPPPPTGTALVHHNPEVGLEPWMRIEAGQPSGVTTNPYVSSVPNGITAGSGGYYANVRVADDPLGQRGKVFELTTTADSKFLSGSGSMFERCDLWQHNSVPWNVNGSEIWENVKIMFPTSWRPSTSYYNWIYQHHDGSKVSGGVPGVGIVIGMTPEASPKFWLRVPGGEVGTSSFVTRTFTGPTAQRNHWYEVELHIKWSTSAGGLCEWYIDGTLVGATTQPTLGYKGSAIDDPNYQLSNYHIAVGQNSTIYFDGPRIARTRQDAAFA